MYQLRGLDQEHPDQLPRKEQGSVYALAVLGTVAVVVIGTGLLLGLQAQSEVRMSISNVTASVGPCDTSGTAGNPAYGTQFVNYSFSLTNSGTRDAYVILYLYGNGAVLGWTSPIRVDAGQTVSDEESTTTYSCGPVTPTVAIHSVSPLP